MDRPLEILEKAINKPILLKLKGKRELRGVLRSYDQHLNLFLENAEQITENGELEELGSIILRGDNVILVSPP
jgi:small nuclear ribonucleoprotein